MNIATRLSALILLSIGISVPAQAYLDPGTGSLIIQSIIGAIAAASITAKLWWHKLKVYFIKSSATHKNTAEDDAQV